jgi:hypothetical protein
MVDLQRTGFVVLQHTFESIRDAWFEGEVLVIRQIVASPSGVEAGVKLFRLTQAEYVKIAELIATLTQTRAQAAVVGGSDAT